MTVKPDQISFNDRSAGIEILDQNTVVEVAGNDVARAGIRTPDGGIDRADQCDSRTAVAQRRSAGNIRADEIALNHISRSGQSDDSNSRAAVSGNYVPFTQKAATDIAIRRVIDGHAVISIGKSGSTRSIRS